MEPSESEFVRPATLEVPETSEIKRVKEEQKEPVSRSGSLDMEGRTHSNGRPFQENGFISPKDSNEIRRFSFTDVFLQLSSMQESFRNFASRRNSSPLSRRSSKKAKKSRLIKKNGICNVYNSNVSKRDRQYMRDFFTTLIDSKWRWILLVFVIVFVTSWTWFATIYYVICLWHGDLSTFFDNRRQSIVLVPQSSNNNNNTLPREPCIAEIYSYFAAFLFSVETQHTIGYGNRYLTTRCPVAGVTVCLQSICGLLIQSFMVGLVFAKLARPKKRAETLLFSEKAVISLRDGNLCLLFRVGDMRNTHLVEAHVRVQLITQRVTEEGEVEPLHQHELAVGHGNGDDDRIFLVWPITICHIIDADSPLYEYGADDLPTAQFEIVVVLEGIVESTGMTAQARTSYLPSEILWGHRFEKLVTYQKCNGSYEVDYSLLQSTYKVKTPRCSTKELKEKGTKNPGKYYCKTEQDEKVEQNRINELTPLASPLPTRSSSPCSHADSEVHSISTSGERSREDSLTGPPRPTPLIVIDSPSSPPTSPAAKNRRSFFPFSVTQTTMLDPGSTDSQTLL